MAEPGTIRVNSLAVARENVGLRGTYKKTPGDQGILYQHKHNELERLGIYKLRAAEEQARRTSTVIKHWENGGAALGLVISIPFVAFVGEEVHSLASNFMKEGYSASATLLSMALAATPGTAAGYFIGRSIGRRIASRSTS